VKQRYIKKYLDKNNDWKYKVSFQLKGHRVRTQNLNSLKEAVGYRDKIRLLILTGDYESFISNKVSDSNDNLTLRDLINLIKNRNAGDIKDTTKKSYEYVMDRVIVPLIGNVKVSKITNKHFSKIYSDSINKGISPQSIKTYFAVLSYVLRQARQEGLINEVPKPIQQIRKKSRDAYLTDAELELLYQSFDSPYFVDKKWLKVAILLQLNCFIRVGELIGLNWEDICFETKTISITKQFNSLHKISDTKNGRTQKSLPLSDDVIVLLKDYKDEVGNLKFLFPATAYFSKTKRSKNRNSDKIKRLDRSTYHYCLKRLAVEVGIGERKMSSHAFRKTGADGLVRNGFSVPQVAYLLRIDPITILKNYSSVDEDHIKQKLQKHLTNQS